MRILIFFLFLFPLTKITAQSVNKFHSKSILVDTHNDVLSSAVLDGIDISNRVKEGHSDLVRWKEGGLDVQFFSVFTGEKKRTAEGFFHDAIQEIDSLNRLIDRNPGKIMLAKTYRDVKRGLKQQKLVALIGVEGGHMIEDDLAKFDSLEKLGMRYLTLTWNNSTSWATSAADETTKGDSLAHKGLTEFGKQLVKRMNAMGVIVDLSHTGEQTFYDAIATSTKPVILSHSSVWSICPVFRNIKDDQIRAVAKNGGVVCINFYSGFISNRWHLEQQRLTGPFRKQKQEELLQSMDSATMRKTWRAYYDSSLNAVRPTLAELADHIDYIIKLVGDEYVGIGSDYDGVGSLPLGMDDVTTYPKLTEELLRRGYSKRTVKKILGGNVMRVMRANFL